MKLPHGWKAEFDDDDRRVILTKTARNNLRTIFLRYYGPHRLRRIDRHGNPVNDTINPVAPETRALVLQACGERWPG